MESDGEDLENIFDEYENNETDAGTENKLSNETPEAVRIAPPKRIVRNPRLKFNPDRLCGERGIPVLVDHFKNVKFKGIGHEKEDLDKLLSKLEHWAHRLFPSMKFEDCLTHIERLGKKRQVQTCLRKIRLDMPILSSDFVKDDDEEDNVKRNDDPDPVEINAFDRLLGEKDEISSINKYVPEDVPNTSSLHSSPILDGLRSHVLGSSFGSSLTEEQKERMERNKMLAAERRKAKLAAMEQSTSRLHSENNETTVSENVLKEQSSFNKLLDSSECNEVNAENLKSSLITNQDFEENSKMSSDLTIENSEKLGLDELMNLVDEEDSVSDENAIALPSEVIESVSDSINETNEFSQDNVEDFKNFQSGSENTENKNLSPVQNSEKSTEENVSIKSSLDFVCETSIDSGVKADVSCSINDTSVSSENAPMENKDLTYMDYEDEIS